MAKCQVSSGPYGPIFFQAIMFGIFLADLKNRPTRSLCGTHILAFCGYFKGQEQAFFNPTSWHLVTYNF